MEEINLYDLLRYYMKRWPTIISAAIIGAIIGVTYTFYIQKPIYTSSATVLVLGTDRTTANQESVILNNYVELFTSRRVLTPVINTHSYDSGYDKLVKNTSAENVKGTDIINVSMATPDAKKSKVMLEGTIEKFGEQAKELYGDSSVKINIVDSADTPDEASNVKPLQQIGLTTISGVAIIIIVLFFMYDYKLSQKPQLKKNKKSSKTEKTTKRRKETKKETSN